MLPEYFGDVNGVYGELGAGVISTIRSVYKQERDWTCSLACLRTVLRNRFTEDWLIERCSILPGPKCSKDLKQYLTEVDMTKGVTFGCDVEHRDIKPVSKLELLMRKNNVMIEIMLNYAHWVVLLGIYKMSERSKDTVVLYDPYFDLIRTFPLEEIISMWYGTGDNTLDHDYVAVLKEGKGNGF